MIRYEYFQETSESIDDDNWQMLLDKHGSQGWELSSITHQDVYKMNVDENSEGTYQKDKDNMQTIYIIIFKRRY
ncbi:MAG: hypothetical protein SCM11_12130 [Bacillota bacterium]|nr:hypothetical protein [Bacillota bacterium]